MAIKELVMELWPRWVTKMEKYALVERSEQLKNLRLFATTGTAIRKRFRITRTSWDLQNLKPFHSTFLAQEAASENVYNPNSRG